MSNSCWASMQAFLNSPHLFSCSPITLFKSSGAKGLSPEIDLMISPFRFFSSLSAFSYSFFALSRAAFLICSEVSCSNRYWTKAVEYSASRPIFMVGVLDSATSSMISTNSFSCSRLEEPASRSYSICSLISVLFSKISFIPSTGAADAASGAGGAEGGNE